MMASLISDVIDWWSCVVAKRPY